MAKCLRCGREMLTAYGCSCKSVNINGKRITRIRVGSDGDFLKDSPRYCRCHDCNAMTGFFHHWGCDAERCPNCGRQIITCSCDAIPL